MYSTLSHSGKHRCIAVWSAVPLDPLPLLSQLGRCYELTLQEGILEMWHSNQVLWLLACFSCPNVSNTDHPGKNKPKTAGISKVQRLQCFNLPFGSCKTAYRSGAVEMEWTEGEHTKKKTKKIEKISDILHSWQREWKEPGEKQSKVWFEPPSTKK